MCARVCVFGLVVVVALFGLRGRLVCFATTTVVGLTFPRTSETKTLSLVGVRWGRWSLTITLVAVCFVAAFLGCVFFVVFFLLCFFCFVFCFRSFVFLLGRSPAPAPKNNERTFRCHKTLDPLNNLCVFFVLFCSLEQCLFVRFLVCASTFFLFGGTSATQNFSLFFFSLWWTCLHTHERNKTKTNQQLPTRRGCVCFCPFFSWRASL